MALDQVVEEELDVAREVGLLSGSHEAVDVHVAIRSIPQVPGCASELDGSDGLSGRGNWAGSSEAAHPDHDLVFFLAGGGGRGEDV